MDIRQMMWQTLREEKEWKWKDKQE